MEELLHWYDALQSKDHIFKATQRCAGGIIQAIEHFALGSYEVPADRIKNSSTTFDPESSDRKPASGSATREIVDVNTALVMWVNGDIPNTDAAHNRILGVMVCILEACKDILSWFLGCVTFNGGSSEVHRTFVL